MGRRAGVEKKNSFSRLLDFNIEYRIIGGGKETKKDAEWEKIK